MNHRAKYDHYCMEIVTYHDFIDIESFSRVKYFQVIEQLIDLGTIQS